jgi:hypothetical protein
MTEVTIEPRVYPMVKCLNAVRGCNVTFQISIQDELVCKLGGARNDDVI